ncbi:hypothetical protein [Selenomonas sputigena]|uniref:hypothetical protein n=1 Tax=Selenomonas sputigena TaxID=69823 RepID=UPI001E48FBD8|nr:hypothetical protein [Selenomonas sputigena]
MARSALPAVPIQSRKRSSRSLGKTSSGKEQNAKTRSAIAPADFKLIRKPSQSARNTSPIEVFGAIASDIYAMKYAR